MANIRIPRRRGDFWLLFIFERNISKIIDVRVVRFPIKWIKGFRVVAAVAERTSEALIVDEFNADEAAVRVLVISWTVSTSRMRLLCVQIQTR